MGFFKNCATKYLEFISKYIVAKEMNNIYDDEYPLFHDSFQNFTIKYLEFINKCLEIKEMHVAEEMHEK